jgi:hypothetical protein
VFESAREGAGGAASSAVEATLTDVSAAAPCAASDVGAPGIFRRWPTEMRLRSRSPFRATSFPSEAPKRRAMIDTVSPRRTR